MIEEKELNTQRIILEEEYDRVRAIIDSKIGVYYSENDIIIEANLNNLLWEIQEELNEIYFKLENL